MAHHDEGVLDAREGAVQLACHRAAALVGAGALVTEGKEFPDNMLILGSPAKAVRALTADDITRLQGNAVNYVQRGQLFNTQLKKIG